MSEGRYRFRDQDEADKWWDMYKAIISAGIIGNAHFEAPVDEMVDQMVIRYSARRIDIDKIPCSAHNNRDCQYCAYKSGGLR